MIFNMGQEKASNVLTKETAVKNIKIFAEY